MAGCVEAGRGGVGRGVDGAAVCEDGVGGGGLAGPACDIGAMMVCGIVRYCFVMQ